MAETIEALEQAMAAAVAAEDYEAAAQLRDRIRALRDGASYFKRQTPGAMGLGTDQQAYRPPEGWRPPSKPDPMTAGHKPGGRRRK